MFFFRKLKWIWGTFISNIFLFDVSLEFTFFQFFRSFLTKNFKGTRVYSSPSIIFIDLVPHTPQCRPKTEQNWIVKMNEWRTFINFVKWNKKKLQTRTHTHTPVTYHYTLKYFRKCIEWWWWLTCELYTHIYQNRKIMGEKWHIKSLAVS